MSQAGKYLEALLKRPVTERARAARRLLESLDDEADSKEVQEAQLKEILRRMEELDAGDMKLVSASESRARIRARLRAIRAR